MPFEVDAFSGCHVWTGKNDHGYPLNDDRSNGQSKWWHIAVWEAANGPVPDGMQVDHACRVTRCGRLEHLEVVSQAENVRRKYWAHRSKLTHCPKKHSLFEFGRRTPTGGTVCKKCCGLT